LSQPRTAHFIRFSVIRAPGDRERRLSARGFRWITILSHGLSLLLIAVALVTSLIPARRAIKTDPN
jgi:hypothetical protein